jgi:hypothetical protein
VKATAFTFAAMLLTVWQAHLPAQSAPITEPRPESAILRRAAENIQSVEPEWRFVSAICNCARLDEQQVGVAAGSWRQPGDDASTRSIEVRVHGIANRQAASRWIARAKHRKNQSDEWTHSDCDLGDGCYTATYQDGRRYEVNFRKGRFLGFVSGESRVDVQRFAKYLLAAMAKS